MIRDEMFHTSQSVYKLLFEGNQNLRVNFILQLIKYIYRNGRRSHKCAGQSKKHRFSISLKKNKDGNQRGRYLMRVGGLERPRDPKALALNVKGMRPGFFII
jgi:hypothetical protein